MDLNLNLWHPAFEAANECPSRQTCTQPSDNPPSDIMFAAKLNVIFVILSILSSEALDKYLWPCDVSGVLFLSHCALSHQKEEERGRGVKKTVEREQSMGT